MFCRARQGLQPQPAEPETTHGKEKFWGPSTGHMRTSESFELNFPLYYLSVLCL